ncbi:MAG: alanyl-tRNA editing protein [Deltaproteobacteria bacterium]|nr:alanyl-tRNA editing protein [Deltaproteobacteria bacterium]
MTRRLYWENPLLFEFEAQIIAHSTWRGAPSVVLDATAFYPEAGGQMPDHGELANRRVLDVQLDEGGTIHHLLEGEPPDVGARVQGSVNARRRREHMALHTGQHMLSHAMLDAAGAKTVSSRLGERVSTLDVDVADLSADAIAEALAAVNAIIDEDRPVRASFPAADVLASLPLRRTPKVKHDVRVVDIEGFDVTPCGGTHATHTSQVGGIHVLGHARHKGGTRLTFLTGPRLRRLLCERASSLDGLAARFTCAPEDVPRAVANLDAEWKQARAELGAARGTLAGLTADALAADASDARVAAHLDGDMDQARAISRKLVDQQLTVLLATGTGERLRVLASRPEGDGPDLGHFLRETAGTLGGAAGGRPHHAEGRIPRDAFPKLREHFLRCISWGRS